MLNSRQNFRLSLRLSYGSSRRAHAVQGVVYTRKIDCRLCLWVFYPREILIPQSVVLDSISVLRNHLLLILPSVVHEVGYLVSCFRAVRVGSH